MYSHQVRPLCSATCRHVTHNPASSCWHLNSAPSHKILMAILSGFCLPLWVPITVSKVESNTKVRLENHPMPTGLSWALWTRNTHQSPGDEQYKIHQAPWAYFTSASFSFAKNFPSWILIFAGLWFLFLPNNMLLFFNKPHWACLLKFLFHNLKYSFLSSILSFLGLIYLGKDNEFFSHIYCTGFSFSSLFHLLSKDKSSLFPTHSYFCLVILRCSYKLAISFLLIRIQRGWW